MPCPLCKFCANRVPQNSFAWVTFPSGMTHLMYYCPGCMARVGSPVKQFLLEKYRIDPDDIPRLEAEVWQGTTKIKRELSDEGKNAEQFTVDQLKTMPYQEYLKTAHWKLLSEKVKRRAKYRCQLCNAEGVLNVHHRTYERRGHEQLKDLICLCRQCHAKFHDKLP
jgi:hypothetical protein